MLVSLRVLKIRIHCKYKKDAVFYFVSVGARPVRVQHHVLWKVAKIDICMVSGMARSARGSARAPIKIWKSYSSIKIDTFTLFDHCHNFKTCRNTTLRSLMENENFQILKFLIFKIFENFQKLHFHENSQKLKCVQMLSSLRVLKIRIHCKYKKDAVFYFVSIGARQNIARPVCAQHHVLWKVAKIDICMVSGMARCERGSARAPIKIWKLYSSLYLFYIYCIFFIFTMYSYLQNSQRYKHLKFCQMCPENRIFWTHSRNRGGPPLRP